MYLKNKTILYSQNLEVSDFSIHSAEWTIMTKSFFKQKSW
jgi:hypothetical protein